MQPSGSEFVPISDIVVTACYGLNWHFASGAVYQPDTFAARILFATREIKSSLLDVALFQSPSEGSC